MSIHWPQAIYLALVFLGLGLELARHGEQKQGRHNFFTGFIASGLVLGLLWWGGFFG